MIAAGLLLFLQAAVASPAAGGAPNTMPPSQRTRPIVVASKPFGESYILAEMFAQLLEARGFVVDRRPGLGATEVAFRALTSGAVDVYPEYTGTGLLAILHDPPLPLPGDVYRRVSTEFRRRFSLRWLPPLGFQNSYAIAMRRTTADSLHVHTLTQLTSVASHLRAGLTPDFIGRADGLPGLGKAYGLHFGEVRTLVPAVKYQALASGAVDVIDGYSTDGMLARFPLVVLEDDRYFFPPYEAAALIGASLSRDVPGAVAALAELSGLLDEHRMRTLNARVEVGAEAVAVVAHDALADLGLLAGVQASVAPTTGASQSGRARWVGRIVADPGRLAHLTGRHLILVAVSLLIAILIGLAVGLALERWSGGAESVIRGIGILQTIPGIALLAFMIPLLGIGVTPALVALVLYSLYPIVRNTYSGVRDADPSAVGAARALGMTDRQILREVRLPLAAPAIMAGIRTAAVINVGTATLAAFIGAGGLGEPIVAGLALSDAPMILSGAIPAALLALVVDLGLGVVERGARPGR